MSTTIDQLELEIQTSSSSAAAGIDALASSLGRLKTAVSGLRLTVVSKQLTTLNTSLNSVSSVNIGNLNSLAQGLQSLSACGSLKISSSVATQITNIGAAIQSLGSTDFSTLNSLAAAITPLTSVGRSNLNGFISQLQRIPQAVDAVSSANLDGLGNDVNRLVTALTPLTQMGRNNLTSFLTQLRRIPQVMEELRAVNMNELTLQIQQLATAFDPLATRMQSIANGFSAFPARIQRLIQSTDRLSSSNHRASRSYVTLAAKIHLASTAVKAISKTIAGWINRSNKYVEDVNLFTVAMGDYAGEAKKYAEQVGEYMGIDPGEWMRNQGTFMTLAEGFGVVSDRAYTMSQNLTQLGYDISSFFNISFEDSMAKLQSGLAGELEPLRRLGYDLSVARLQQEAYALGIKKKVTAMTQAEKAELRYYAIMTQVTKAHGDMARTINTPANQLRILRAQVEQAARALGNVFIPILRAVLPYAIALAKIVRMLAEAFASFVGFTLPEIDFGSTGVNLGGVSDSAADLNENLSGATKSAKELKNAMLGIDELNVISPPEDTGGSGGAGIGGGGGLGFELPTYDFIGDLVNDEVEKATEKLKELLPVIVAVGAALATWKLADWLANLMGVKDVIGALTGADYLSMFAGLLMSVGGAILYASGAFDAMENGVDWANLAMLLGGVAAAAAGLYLILKPFSTTIAPIAGWATAAAGGLGILAISLGDIEKNGSNLANIAGSIAGITLTVVGLTKAFQNSSIAIAPLIAPLAGYVASLALAKTSISDMVANGPGFENVLGSIAGAVAGVNLAVKLCTAACAVNPILGGLVIAGTVVAAFATIVGAIQDAGAEIYESSDDFKIMENILARSAEASERCVTAMSTMQTNIKNLETVGNDFATASMLLDEIMAINENADASAYELALMEVKVGILNGLNIAGLSLSIDETTGRVIQSREEVEKLIASLEQQARMEALTSLLVQCYRDQYTAMIDAERAARDYDAANEALSTTANELLNTPWYDIMKRGELKAAHEKQTAAVEAATTAYENASTTYYNLNDTISTYMTQLTNLKTEQASVADPMVDSMDAVQTALDETVAKMPGYGTDIADGLVNAVKGGITVPKFKDIWSTVGTSFTDSYEIKSPSRVFEGYGENLVDGLLNGVKQYTSMQSTVTDWANAITKWFTDNASYNKFYSVASDVIDGFKDGIGALYSKCKSTITSWGSSIISWFKNKLDSHSPSRVFERIGEDTILGYNIGLKNIGNTTKGVVNKWADSFTSVSPTLGFAVDTSALRYYNSDSFARSVSATVSSNTSVTATGFKEGMEEFYREYMEPTMVQMASDMRRQADKKEQTVVQIGNRTVNDAVTTQRNANGYVFAT